MQRITLSLACALIATGLSAQEPPRLTLAQVYASLAAGSPRIAAANAQASAAHARIGPASRWPDPSIQLGLMNRNLPGLGLQDPLGMNQIQVMQMVPVAGKTGLAVEAARADATAEEARAREVSWEVRARAAMSFYDIYQADHDLSSMLESRRLLQDIVQTASAMYAEGRGRQADVVRGQVSLARMDEELIRMRAMREGAAARLNGLRGVPVDEAVPPPVLPIFPDPLPSREDLEASALGGRQLLLAGAARIEASGALARRAGREIWPDLTLGVIYGQRPMTDGGTDRMASFMLGFTLPLSAGSRQHQMAAEARAMNAMAVADLDDLRNETRARIGELYAELVRTRDLGTLYHATLIPEIHAAAASALSGYRGGTVDFMTVLDSQMESLRASREFVRFDAERGKALAELEMLTATELLDPASTAGSAGDAP